MGRIIDFSKSIDFKVYFVILVVSLMLLVFGVRFYQDTKSGFLQLSDEGKVNITKNLVENFNTWINERSNMLTNVSKIIEKIGATDSDDMLNDVIKTFYDNSKNFHIVQYLSVADELYTNGYKVKDKIVKERSELSWYKNTKEQNKPTLTYMPRHYQLQVPTINICVPVHKHSQFEGVLCGVVKLEDIFKNIKNFKLPLNAYSFLAMQDGTILTQIENQSLIENKLKEKISGDDISGFSINSNFIAISEIPDLSWFIGVGANDTKGIKEIIGKAQQNAFWLSAGFIFLILIANFLHNRMYSKVKQEKEAYEILLEHKTKMGEMGELIAGINHQFIQPINSLKLMISTLLVLKQEKSLGEDELEEMLQSGKGSVNLLSDTVEIFRNFYKTNDSIEEFDIVQSVKNLLMLMHAELSRANVMVSITGQTQLMLSQKQNIIQQILLILLHNAKDALVEHYEHNIENRCINIDIQNDAKKCYIAIQDIAGGVPKDMVDKIFTTPKTTKKSGNGIGLYFGKKLANEKINGEILLKNRANPTIFELSFDINLRK